jgi:plastocyanin
MVALAVGAAGAPASASDAHVSGLTGPQKKAKAKAIKKCKKIKNVKKKKACIKKVNKKYNKLANVPQGETKTVELGDNFFAPNTVSLKVNDSIEWSWANVGGFEPHNVTLGTGPDGVTRADFQSPTTAATSTRFKRTFEKAGMYNFVCSLHYEMTMTVDVTQ